MSTSPERSPEPSDTAKAATRSCQVILWLVGVLFVLAVVGAIVRGGDSSAAVDTTTALVSQGLSSTTAQCLNERTEGRYQEVVARMYSHPDDPDSILAGELMYGCLTDQEAEDLYPELSAIYPPSYQRCVEDILGWEAFVEEVIRTIEDLDYEWDDAWVECLHLAPNL